jgi:Tol biopolymer transport system component
MLRPLLCAPLLLVLTPAAAGQVYERVNVSTAGVEMSTAICGPFATQCQSIMDVNFDGQHVAFETDNAGLVPGDMNSASDIFVRDRAAGTTIRVSVTSAGVEGLGASNSPSISSDGRFVAFSSRSDFENGGVIATNIEIYVHDRDPDANGVFDEAGLVTTTRVVRGDAGQDANAVLEKPSISDDGRHVAFQTQSDNLDSQTVDGNTAFDIYLLDRDSDGNGVFDEATGTSARLVSVHSATGLPGTGANAVSPKLSGNGQHIVFESARGLMAGTPGPPGGVQVYLRDIVQGTTMLLTGDTNGDYATLNSGPASITPDGRFIVFDSNAFNLLPGLFGQHVYHLDRDLDENGIYDEPAGTELSRADLADGCLGPGNVIGFASDVSDNGLFVTFTSFTSAMTMTGMTDNNGVADVYILDRELCSTTLVSRSIVSPMTASGSSVGSKYSGNFEHVIFVSLAADMLAGDTNGTADIYVLDLPAPMTGNYCTSAPNSSGFASTMFATGTPSVAANDAVLHADNVPLGQPGLFYYGPAQIAAAFGNGTRCVGGSGGTVVRIFPFLVPDGAGVMTSVLDNTLPAHAQVLPGAALNFQCWFRDPMGAGAGFDLSDGFHVVFEP